MPRPDGPEVCRQVRQAQGESRTPKYLILLTAKTDRGEVVEGLQAGADDYITKPFHAGQLRARVGVGARFVELQTALAARVDELQAALAQVTQLQGLLPICAYCKKVRDDNNYWDQVENYLADRSDLRFSHGICPGCYEKVSAEFDVEARSVAGRASSAVEEIADQRESDRREVRDSENLWPSGEGLARLAPSLVRATEMPSVSRRGFHGLESAGGRWRTTVEGQPTHGVTDGERGRSGVGVTELLEQFDGDRDLLSQLSEVFLQEYSGQLSAVRSGLDAHDASAVARSAHTLKGSVEVFGAEAAVNVAQRLETCAKKSDLTDAKKPYEVLEREVTRLAQVLIGVPAGSSPTRQPSKGPTAG